MTAAWTHKPVLLEETLTALNIKADGYYVDGTFGRGGHAQAMLAQLNAGGHLLALDKDPQAIEVAQQLAQKDSRFQFKQGSFAELKSTLDTLDWTGKVNGLLLDLGVSSPQLDDPQRGFSFRHDGPLDMRMDPHMAFPPRNGSLLQRKRRLRKYLKNTAKNVSPNVSLVRLSKRVLNR